MRLEPGRVMGGHCLPVDPFYLSWLAREFDMTTDSIELGARSTADALPLRGEGRSARSTTRA